MQILVEESERPMAIQWERGMTDDEYFQFCADNPDVRIERSAEGDILIMPPVGVVAGRLIPAWNTSFRVERHIRRTPPGFFARGSIS
jgi:Uma2 family endonuclease